jgi:hypothetical protein
MAEIDILLEEEEKDLNTRDEVVTAVHILCSKLKQYNKRHNTSYTSIRIFDDVSGGLLNSSDMEFKMFKDVQDLCSILEE